MSTPQNGQYQQTVVQWPEPAHLRLQQDQSAETHCEVEFANGERQLGFLTYFTGRDAYLTFKSSPDNSLSHDVFNKVDLTDLKQLQLTHPVGARPYEESVSADGETAEQTQVYNVEFNDGEILSGETSGYVSMPNGIFLYSQSGEKALRRSFIPSSAIAYFQIGDPMGKLLVEEHAVSENDLKQAVEKQQEMRKQLLGDYLISEAYVTQEQLDQAVALQKTKPSLRMGEALIEMGALSAAALDAALARQRSNRSRPLSQILIEMGVLDQQTLQKVHEKKKGLPTVSLANFSISSKVRKLIPETTARNLGVIPLAMEDDALIVAFTDTPDTETLNKLKALAGIRVVAVLASTDELRAKQDALYTQDDEVEEDYAEGLAPTTSNAGATSDVMSVDELDHLFDYNEPITIQDVEHRGKGQGDFEHTLLAVTERLLSAATQSGTLDIHIENTGEKRVTRISFHKI